MQQLLATTKNGAALIDVPGPGKSSPDDVSAKLLDVLPGVMWFVRRHMRRLRGKGLSVPAFRAMVLLSRNPDATLSAVSEFLGASMPTSSRIISGLVAKKLISRKNCTQDRRQVSLHLTTAGHALLESAWSGTQAAVARQLTDFTTEEQGTVLRSLDLLARAFQTAHYSLDSDRGGEVCEDPGEENTGDYLAPKP